MSTMQLVVGLGNYPKEYEHTRHNIGFLVVEKLAEQYGVGEWKSEKKFFGWVKGGEIQGEKTIFLKPGTHINLSGKAVQAVAHFYKIPSEKIWVLYDDIDLPFGVLRFRQKGRSGGHNGIKSILDSLGTDLFPRIKFGIRNPSVEHIPTEAFVLQKFSLAESQKLPEILAEGKSVFLSHLPLTHAY